MNRKNVVLGTLGVILAACVAMMVVVKVEEEGQAAASLKASQTAAWEARYDQAKRDLALDYADIKARKDMSAVPRVYEDVKWLNANYPDGVDGWERLVRVKDLVSCEREEMFVIQYYRDHAGLDPTDDAFSCQTTGRLP